MQQGSAAWQLGERAAELCSLGNTQQGPAAWQHIYTQQGFMARQLGEHAEVNLVKPCIAGTGGKAAAGPF
eukprot:207489-Pelagomonas_calceolata.AAC.2